MPESAIATGWIDFVLSPEDIAREIVCIARGNTNVQEASPRFLSLRRRNRGDKNGKCAAKPIDQNFPSLSPWGMNDDVFSGRPHARCRGRDQSDAAAPAETREAYLIVPGWSIFSGSPIWSGMIWFSVLRVGPIPSWRIPVAVFLRRGVRLTTFSPFRGLACRPEVYLAHARTRKILGIDDAEVVLRPNRENSDSVWGTFSRRNFQRHLGELPICGVTFVVASDACA